MLKGYKGSWTHTPAVLSNEYFKILLGLTWHKTSLSGKMEYRAAAQEAADLLGTTLDADLEGDFVYMLPEDLVIKNDPELSVIAREYAEDNSLFIKDFAAAWTKVMNADRFKGPAGNECSNPAAMHAEDL